MADKQTLRDWFVRRQAEIERDKIGALVRHDLDRGWSVTVNAAESVNEVRVTSKLAIMPITVAVPAIGVSQLEVRRRGQSPQRLMPGGEVAVPFEVATPTPSTWLTKLLTTERTARRMMPVQVAATITPDAADELKTALKIEPVHGISQTITADVLVHTPGTPLYQQIIILVLLAIAVVAVWRTWIAPTPPVPKIARQIQITEIGGPFSETLRIQTTPTRKVVVGNTSDVDVKSAVPEGSFALVIVSSKPRFPMLQPARGLYAYLLTGYVSYTVMKRGRKEERPLSTSSARAVPINFGSRLIVSTGTRKFEIRLRK